ncbi:MAG TPA: hypothetical protein VMM76_12035 [Pirellulaceae bacterium]|nr:hypothetical protein [Pirellulaceae bacterium]
MTNRIDRILRTNIYLVALVVATAAGRGYQRSTAAEPEAAGRHLILSVEEGDSSVGIYDSKTEQEVSRIDLGHVKETQRQNRRHTERHRSYVGMWPHEITLSADGRTAYVTHFGLKDYDELIGATGSTISIIDVEKMCELRRLYTFGFDHGEETIEEQFYKYRAPHGVKLQPNTNRLFVNVEANLGGTNNHHMLVYDLNTDASVPAAVWDIPEKTHNFVFSKDGKSLWLFSGPDGVTRFEFTTIAQFPPDQKATFVREVGTDEQQRLAIRGLTLTPDGERLIASGQGEILVLDSESLRLLHAIPVPDVRQFLYSSVTADGRFLLAPAVWEGKVVIIDLARQKVVQELLLGSDPVHVALSPDERSAYVTHGRDNYISVLDITRLLAGEVAREASRIPTHDGPNRLAIVKVPPDQHASKTLKPRRQRLRFGACLPLSGQNIVEGQDMRLGYQYWRDSINRRGGLCIGDTVYEVELSLRDTQSLSKGLKADALLRKLTLEMLVEAEEDSVPLFFLGTYPTPPNIPSGAIATAAGIPFVTAGAAGVVVYDQDKNHLNCVFGVMSPARGFLNGTMDMMLGEGNILPDQQAPPVSGLFITSDDFGAFQDAVTTSKHILTTYGDVFDIVPSINDEDFGELPELAAFRIETIEADPDLNTPAFRLVAYTHPETQPQIDQLRKEFPRLLEFVKSKVQPEVLALTAHMPQAIDFTYAAASVWSQAEFDAASYPKAIVLSVGPGNPYFIRQLQRQGVSPAGLIGASVWSPNQRQFGHDEFIDSQTFREKFEARFHRPPSYLTAGAVACGLVYEEAFRRAGTIARVDVRDHLQSISDHQANSLAAGSIDLFYSRIDFRDDDQIRGLNDRRPLGTIQLQESAEGQLEDIVLWPQQLSQERAKLDYPFPGFSRSTRDAAFRGIDSDDDLWKY